MCHAFMGAAESARPTLGRTPPFEATAFFRPSFEVYGPLCCFLVGPAPPFGAKASVLRMRAPCEGKEKPLRTVRLVLVSEQYFSDQVPAADSDLRTITIEARGHEFSMRVSAKIFSASRLDLGTRQLLSEAPELPESGRFLDIGCGWGPIALTMAKDSPEAEVWAVDVNSRAVDLTARNASLNGCPNVRAMLEEDALATVEAEDARFNVIWSNPPIRIGKEALHALLRRWCDRLAPGGVAYFVVQRNLGADSLIAWLNGQGYTAAKIASKKGFRIIEVRPGA